MKEKNLIALLALIKALSCDKENLLLIIQDLATNKKDTLKTLDEISKYKEVRLNIIQLAVTMLEQYKSDKQFKALLDAVVIDAITAEQLNDIQNAMFDIAPPYAKTLVEDNFITIEKNPFISGLVEFLNDIQPLFKDQKAVFKAMLDSCSSILETDVQKILAKSKRMKQKQS